MGQFNAAVRALVHRPGGLVARTRWLFTALAVASTLVQLPGLTQIGRPAFVVVVVLAYLGLSATWSYRYLSGRSPALAGVGEALLMMAAVICGSDPAAVYSFLFTSLWLRSLYGSTRGVFGHTALVAVAVVAGTWAWTVLHEHGGGPATAPLTIVSSTLEMFLTVAVARYLATNLFAREQAQQRDAALVRLGDELLLGVRDRTGILEVAGACIREICAATPGLRALLVLVVDGNPVVADQAGEGAPAPRMLPWSVLPEQRGTGARAVPDPGPLATVGPAGSSWRAVPLADRDTGWVLLGAAKGVPHEAELAVGSMTNQVALALRNNDALRDLTTQASEDALTGLANRAAFTAALEAGMAAPGRPIALLFLDLDDFKLVNDGMGHGAGDELLRRIADRLRAGVRARDLCARIGGDEFAVLLHDSQDAVAIGQRLVELVAVPVSLDGHTAQVGASVGLAYAHTHDTSGEQLVQRADVAMYAAKAKGKNRVQVFDPSLLQDDGRKQFEAEIDELAAGRGLVVHYQPIVRVHDGWCIAIEALARWEHPTQGLLQPAEFIPTAEGTGAIVGIGAQVLRRACADVVSWAGPSGPLAVHVNVSAAQLTGPGFADEVSSCLTEHALDPGRLVLEITESMVLDSSVVRDMLITLTGLGVKIAIDDFGTGYSALSTLRSLPLSVVKIDRSFLAPGTSRATDETVIEAIVALADRLGIQVVAEGVERVDQQAFLHSIGAHAAQGYLHLRPTAAPEFEHWLGEHTQAQLTIQPMFGAGPPTGEPSRVAGSSA